MVTWSIAYRGFDACGSAVDRAILFVLAEDLSDLASLPAWEAVRTKTVSSNLEQKLVT